MDASMVLTPELASRMAVVAVTADVEFWASTVSVDGRVGLQDLTRTLEVIRLAAAADQTRTTRSTGSAALRGTWASDDRVS
jgi:hypothetical protein